MFWDESRRAIPRIWPVQANQFPAVEADNHRTFAEVRGLRHDEVRADATVADMLVARLEDVETDEFRIVFGHGAC